MASQQEPYTPDIISEDEINILKLIKMAHGTARSVLYKIFLWGTKQEPHQSVADYLLKTKNYSRTRYGNCFDSYQLKVLSDRSLEIKFDVTILCKVIRHTCDKLDSSPEFWKSGNKNKDRLECLVTAVKGFRDDHSHNFFGISVQELVSKAICLTDLLKKTLSVAGELYEKLEEEINRELVNVEKDINAILDQNLAASDISDCQVILQNEKFKKFLKEKGAIELKDQYKLLCQLNPVSFLESKGVLLDINMVFTQVEVENAGQKAKGLQVPCHEILSFCRNNTTVKQRTKIDSPEIYLIEGQAGAGKTTLMKYMKACWLNKEESMLGLNDFDLLLYMECRNTSLSSLSQLLNQLMPMTNSTYFGEGQLLKYTLALNTLILVDGLDELNSSSEKLFSDIINQNNKNLVVFCTSRPEKTRYFKITVPSTFQTAHLKIIGIADNKREEFIRKYHGEMQKHGISTQNTESLVTYIKRSESLLKNHYRLPLNLVLLTWLWADDPNSVNPLTTSSELYIQTHNLMKKKLLERLAHHEKTCNIDLQDLEEKIKKVLCSVYKSALLSLSRDAIESLLEESVNRMKDTCIANNLPPRETLSAFFVIKIVEGEEKVSVPHKLLHDFYAAQCIVQNLFNENQESKKNALIQRLAVFCNEDTDSVMLQEFLSLAAKVQTTTAPEPGFLKTLVTEHSTKESGNIHKYQSMLLHVAGIIYALHAPQVQEWMAKEIVELLKDSELGLKDNDEWFDLFALTKNDPIVMRHVSNYISSNITITDERIEAALCLLLTAKPKIISVSITRKARDIQKLQTLLDRIAKCGSQLNLAFWQDFWNPDSQPSNDQELRIISKR